MSICQLSTKFTLPFVGRIKANTTEPDDKIKSIFLIEMNVAWRMVSTVVLIMNPHNLITRQRVFSNSHFFDLNSIDIFNWEPNFLFAHSRAKCNLLQIRSYESRVSQNVKEKVQSACKRNLLAHFFRYPFAMICKFTIFECFPSYFHLIARKKSV